MTTLLREIPCNYATFSDHEITIHTLEDEAWNIYNSLRAKRCTDRLATCCMRCWRQFMVSHNPQQITSWWKWLNI